MKNKIEEQTEMDSNDFTVEVMPMFCTLNWFRRTLNVASFEDGLLLKKFRVGNVCSNVCSQGCIYCNKHIVKSIIL